MPELGARLRDVNSSWGGVEGEGAGGKGAGLRDVNSSCGAGEHEDSG